MPPEGIYSLLVLEKGNIRVSLGPSRGQSKGFWEEAGFSMAIKGWVRGKFYLKKGTDTKRGHPLWGAEV